MEATKTASIIENKIFWKTHFEQYKLSSLTKRDYARSHQLIYHRFKYWSRKFEKTAETATVLISNSGFVPVKIKADLAKTQPQEKEAVLCTLQLQDNKQLVIHTEAALKLCLEALR